MEKSLIVADEEIGFKINEKKRQSTWWLVGKIGIWYKKKLLKKMHTDLKKWTNSNTYSQSKPKTTA